MNVARLLVVPLLAALLVSLACHARPPFYGDKTNLLIYRDLSGLDHPISTPADWARRRADVLSNVQLVMGRLPDATRKVPLDLKVVEEVAEDKYVRRKVTFASEAGDRVPAYLLIPN